MIKNGENGETGRNSERRIGELRETNAVSSPYQVRTKGMFETRLKDNRNRFYIH